MLTADIHVDAYVVFRNVLCIVHDVTKIDLEYLTTTGKMIMMIHIVLWMPNQTGVFIVLA